MLDREEGLAVAAEFLAANYRGYPHATPVRTEPESAFVVDSVLIVPWNSVAALDDGDELAELGGNMSIRVDLGTGQCRFLGYGEIIEYSRRRSDS